MTIIEEFKSKAQSVIEGLKRELSGVRTNRPTTALVDDLKVSYYGQMMPIKQVGTTSVIPPREIVVQVWDENAVQSVIKAIDAMNPRVGTAQAEGTAIHIRLPELSAERREELVKHIRKVSEEHRIQIRHVRDEINKKIQRMFDDNELSEDQKFKSREGVQKEVDAANSTIEQLLEGKIKEIMV